MAAAACLALLLQILNSFGYVGQQELVCLSVSLLLLVGQSQVGLGAWGRRLHSHTFKKYSWATVKNQKFLLLSRFIICAPSTSLRDQFHSIFEENSRATKSAVFACLFIWNLSSWQKRVNHYSILFNFNIDQADLPKTHPQYNDLIWLVFPWMSFSPTPFPLWSLVGFSFHSLLFTLFQTPEFGFLSIKPHPNPFSRNACEIVLYFNLTQLLFHDRNQLR